MRENFDPQAPSHEEYSYSYHANGNLLTQNSSFSDPAFSAESENLNYSYVLGTNLLESVEKVGVGVYGMQYDANGNLSSDAMPKLLEGGVEGPVVTSIVSNHQNLPTRIEMDLPNSDHQGVIEYRYDSEGS
ncbi:MAG: hypothetical protein KC518_14685, partial [Candidatus Cloacimonetes bacterium]|nr:hypothetical protein [Candidatus Cloacimonadota bacterium]